MRVAPLGAFFADHLETVVEQATLSAEVTHAHAEGIAGAIAVAVAAAIATRHVDASPANPSAFLNEVRQYVPQGAVHTGLQMAESLEEASIDEAATLLGNGSRVTAEDTVPFCLWVAARHLSFYEEAMWQTVQVLGDLDTNCAIVGGIVAAAAGIKAIPPKWLATREELPNWHLTDGHQFFR